MYGSVTAPVKPDSRTSDALEPPPLAPDLSVISVTVERTLTGAQIAWRAGGAWSSGREAPPVSSPVMPD